MAANARLRLAALALLAMAQVPAAGSAAEKGAGGEGKPAKPLVVAHYMSWFGVPEISKGWFQWEFSLKGVDVDKHHYPDRILPGGNRDIAAVHYPSIGPYDSTDPRVAEYHILLAKEAGIDAFMVNWYGLRDRDGYDRQENKGFEALLKAAEKLGFKVCLNIDDKCAFPPYRNLKTREEAVRFAKDTLAEAMRKYASSPAYLRVAGRPVFSNFGISYVTSDSIEQKSFSVSEWRSILDFLRDFRPYFIHDHQWDWRKTIREAGFHEFSDSVYSWVGRKEDRVSFLAESAELLKEKKLGKVTGSANPGFDNSPCWGWGGGMSQVPRRGGNEYKEQLEECAYFNADLVHLVTWNDFTEGSTIEPTKEYGTQYLELTADAVNRWAGASLHGKLLDVPEQVFHLRKGRDLLAKYRVSSSSALDKIDAATDEAVSALQTRNRPGLDAALGSARGLLEAEKAKLPQSRQLEAALSPDALELFNGDSARLTLRLKNAHRESVPAYVELNRSQVSRSWLGDLEKTVWLRPGEEKEIHFSVRIPPDAEETAGWLHATVDSPYAPVNSNISFFRVLRPLLRAEVGPINLLRAGRMENLALSLESRRKSNQPVRLEFSAPRGWIVRTDRAGFELPARGKIQVPFSVTVPAGAKEGGAVEVRLKFDDGETLTLLEPYGVMAEGKAARLQGDINQDGEPDYVLGNEQTEIQCTSAIGGRILAAIRRATGRNQVFLDYPRVSRTQGDGWDQWAEYGGINDWFPGDWPGKVWNNSWEAEMGDHGEGEVFLTLSSKLPEQQLQIQRTLYLSSHSAGAKLLYEIRNLGEEEKTVLWTSHPDLAPGGSAGGEDLMIVPIPKRTPDSQEFVKKGYSPRLQKTHFVPGENWVLGYDTQNKEYFAQIFNSSLVEKVGAWEGKDFFTMELIFNPMQVGPGEIKKFSVDYVIGQDELDAAIQKLREKSN